MLKCSSCSAVLDLDEHPDVGVCPTCNGDLVQNGETPEDLHRGFDKDLQEAVEYGMAKIATTSGLKRGLN